MTTPPSPPPGPRVFWLTGLSGSGKTTLALALADTLRAQNLPVIRLDGDELREIFDAVSGHDRPARLALALRYARLCRLLATQGFTVVIATISLFHEVHAWNRQHLPGYREVFLDVPLAELARRDPKGLYARARRGEVSQVAGLDLIVDYPLQPHLHLRWDPAADPASWLAAILALPPSR